MTTHERRASRTLSPVQIRAIALRVQGLDITAIASEVGRDRTTVSRWFTTDPLVIEELDRRVEDQYETELQQLSNLRKKAMGVLDAALDSGDVRAALTILRVSPRQKDHTPAGKGISPANPSGAAEGYTGLDDVEVLLHELQRTSPWQVHVQRVDALLRSLDAVSDADGILDRLLCLDDVASTVVRALEQANGEGLTGYSSVSYTKQSGYLGDARQAIDQGWAIVGGADEDDDDDPRWPGEEDADRVIKLMAQALLALLVSLDGAPEALTIGAGANGSRLASRLTSARDAVALLLEDKRRPTVQSLADAVTTLTGGFRDLVGALDEGAAITVDATWAEAADGREGIAGT